MERISFAFLDGDFYESIRVSLELVAPRMDERGVIIVHDYHNEELPGVTRAVEEWVEKNPDYDLRQVEGLAVFRRKI